MAVAPLTPVRVSASEGGFWTTFKALWPYLWPRDRRDLQTRVLIAFALLVTGRFVLVGVPYAFKWATDALTNQRGAFDVGTMWPWLAAI